MGIKYKLKIEITYGEDNYYHVEVNGVELKMCNNYDELVKCMGSLIKSHCKRKHDDKYY